MATFDLGIDDAAPPEYLQKMQLFYMIFFSLTLYLRRLLVYIYFIEAKQEPEKVFSEDRKETFSLPQLEMSQKRFKSITESEFKQLQEKRQSGVTKKSTK